MYDVHDGRGGGLYVVALLPLDTCRHKKEKPGEGRSHTSPNKNTLEATTTD